ncbi:hypothetical protein TUMEXPCC7403_13910 [Tumidithrix helvetica PCC 7403]|uniref:hypothetical protein n=1 Tax=Tumidithrix helvetica TaxID=3457545 RepID=UPI003C9A754A
MWSELRECESNQVSWTLSDYLGTVRDLVSSAGVVQKHIKYDSFGNVRAQSAPLVKSRFGFTGRGLTLRLGFITTGRGITTL